MPADRGSPPEVHLQSAHGTARISLLGATVLSWVPRGQPEVLWLSPNAVFREGTAIRGGIPVCWPWFASDPAHPDGPSHGLVRTRLWSLDHQDRDGDTASARLSVSHSDDAVFPPFRLELEVRVAQALTLRLTHVNLASRPVDCRGALHSYLRADASRARVFGMGPALATDKIAGRQIALEDPFRFEPPNDLVVTCDGEVALDDGTRRIRILRRDAPDVVLWNPGAWRPADVPVGGEADFVCVEAAAVHAPWTVPAGGKRMFELTLEPR